MKKLFYLFAFSLLCGCSNKTPVTISGETMGTYYMVKVVGDIEEKELVAKVKARLEELDAVFSIYRKDSELSRINNSEEETHQLSEPLAYVLNKSLEFSRLSNGAFDVTLGQLVNIWGFGPSGIKQRKPQREEIEAILPTVGYQRITLVDRTLTRPKGMIIDLNAVAPGYAVDEVFNLLTKSGLKSLMVDIGGELRAQGKKDQENYWRVGIEQPVEESEVQRVIPLKNMAIATNGSYRNYRKYGDEVFSHTIHPVTGMPVSHQVISVSVLAKNCLEADAWDTALMVLGPEHGLKLANELNLAAYFILKNGDKLETLSSEEFRKYLAELDAEAKAKSQ